VPSVRDEEAWLEEATPEHSAGAVTAVKTMTPAEMSDDDTAELAQMVARRDYTAAELAYAVEQMMYDEDLTKELTSFRDEPRLYPSDFHRFVKEIREKRRRLECVVDRHEMNRLISDFDELTRSDFGITGYTVKDKPLYRFKSDPDAPDGDPNPKLERNHRPGQRRERDPDAGEHGHEFQQIADAIDADDA